MTAGRLAERMLEYTNKKTASLRGKEFKVKGTLNRLYALKDVGLNRWDIEF